VPVTFGLWSLSACRPDPMPVDHDGSTTIVGHSYSPSTTTPTHSDPPVPFDEQCQVLDWVVQVGPGYSDLVRSVVLLQDGGIGLAGDFEGLVRMGTRPTDRLGPAYGLSDGFVAVLEADGSQRWAHGFGGPRSDQFPDLSLAADGTLVAAGRFQGPAFLDRSTPVDFDQLDSFESVVVGFDGRGDLQFAHAVTGERDQFGTSGGLDEAGNRYLTGYFHSESVQLGAFVRPRAPDDNPISPASDAFVASWDPAGNPRWLTTLGGIERDEATWLRFDHGQLLVGFDAVLPDPTVHSAAGDRVLPTAGLWAFATTLDPDTGEVSDPLFSALDVRILTGESGVVAGYNLSPAPWTAPNGNTGPLLPGTDGLPVSFFGLVDPDGRLLAVRPLPTSELGFSRNVGMGRSENRVALTGTYGGAPFILGEGLPREVRLPPVNGNRDSLVSTWTLDGEFRCAWTLNGAMAEDAFDAAIDDEGNLVVVGAFEDAAQLVDGQGNVLHTFTDPGDARPDGFIARFRPAP
jgi:hypothetical protein